MRSLISAPLAFVAMAALPARAGNDLWDSYCLGDGVQAATQWELHADFEEDMAGKPNMPSTFSRGEALAFVDGGLQSLTRQSRARVFANVSLASVLCNAGSGPCIEARTDAEDWFGCGSNDNWAAWSTAGDGIIFCLDNTNGNNVQAVLQHELGHSYGLKHTGPESSPCAESPPADCIGPSDGCEGELMCGNLGCNGSWLGFTNGDAAGLRTKYFGTPPYRNRRWTFGSTLIPGLTGHVKVTPAPPGSMLSVFQPRIDCARADTPAKLCAVVRVYMLGATPAFRITTLEGWNPLGGWDDIESPSSWIEETTTPPDIALSSSGNVAWTTRTSTSGTNNAFVRRTDLVTGVQQVISLGYPSRLPLRIWSRTDNDALVMGARDGALHMVLHRVAFSNGSLSATGYDFGDLDNPAGANLRQVTADYDFDCEKIGTYSYCTLFSQLWNRDLNESAPEFGVPYRRSFVASSSSIITITDWSKDAGSTTRIQAVIGVARTGGEFGSHVYLSAGRAPGLGASNTLHREYLSTSSLTPNLSVNLNSDYEVCADHGASFSATTQHGGASIAYCRACNGGSGSLESVHLGTEENGDDCF